MKNSIWLLAGVLAFGSVSTTAAASDRDDFEKRVRKVAPLTSDKGKALCYCVNQDVPFQGRVGFIRRFLLNDQVYVNCQGDLFDAVGNDIGGFSCTEFRPLVK